MTTFVTKSVSPLTLGNACKTNWLGRVVLPRHPCLITSHSKPFFTAAHEIRIPNIAIGTTLFPQALPQTINFPHRFPNIFEREFLRIPEFRMYPKEIVFLGGAPGSGKGTHSLHIASLRGFVAPTIVVSDLLNTPDCKELKDRGVMVDDAFVFAALSKELQKPIYRNGVVVDGFPRTAKQAELLTQFHHQINRESCYTQMMFVMLHVDETISIHRQLARGKEAVALNQQRLACNLAPFEVRTTDVHVDASKARYEVFKEQLSAVEKLGNLFPFVEVDASSTVEVVRENLATKMTLLP